MSVESRLPRQPEYFLDRLFDLQARIRSHIRSAMRSESADMLASVVDQRGGDTIFALDHHAEDILKAFFSLWGDELPLYLVAEGLPGGSQVFPEGIDRRETAFTCIVDPIDGTRGLMYGKRSAWVLSGIAPSPDGGAPGLDTVEIAVQTELPTTRSDLSDVLWATTGAGAKARTENLATGDVLPFLPRPSTADTLLHGFETVVKFFPGIKVPASEVEERLLDKVLGTATGNLEVYDDEYISSGGQLYELIMGRDRFIADLRPLIARATGRETLCCHPYDLCTELIAREAGVLVTDERGLPLRYPLDVDTECTWIGYANQTLRQRIQPALVDVLRNMDLLPS